MSRIFTIAVFAVAGLLIPTFAIADERVGDPWPLETCVVAGAKLGSMGEPIIKLHEGREVRFCCAGCVGAMAAEPEVYLAKADAEIVKQQLPHYPLDHCIVDRSAKLSDDPEENSHHVIGNRLFILCCAGCEKAIVADPEKYFHALDQAVIAKQRDDYPLDTCPVSGQPVDSAEAIDIVIANQMVRLCCKGCVPKVYERPLIVLDKLAQARGANEIQTTTD